MSEMKSNIFVGLDTGLNSTGIIILHGTGLWGSINITHTVKKSRQEKNGMFVAKFVNLPVVNASVVPADVPYAIPIKKVYNLVDNGTVRQLLTYHEVCMLVFLYLNTACFSESGASVKIGIEIPMGVYQGEGGVDRMFTAMCLGVVSAMKQRETHWDLYEFRPTEIKKFITGKGNCKKELVLKEVYKRFGYDTNISDLADAYAVARLLEHRSTEGDGE